MRAVNFLLPYLQRIPNRLLRSEWASRIAQQLRMEEPVLREALRRAAAERRSEVKTQPELVGQPAKPAERRLMQMLMEAEEFRERLAEEIREDALHRGLETEKIFAALLDALRCRRRVPTRRAGRKRWRNATAACSSKSLFEASAERHLGRGRKLPRSAAPPPSRKRNSPTVQREIEAQPGRRGRAATNCSPASRNCASACCQPRG